MRRKQFDFEDHFGPVTTPNAQVYNVPPNAPPMATRFSLTKNNVTLAVSDVAAQFTISYDNPTPTSPDNSTYLKNTATMLDIGFDKVLKGQAKWFSGVVFLVDLSKGGREFDAKELYTQLFKPSLSGTIVNLGATVGVQRGTFSSSIELNQFKTFTAFAQSPSQIFIDEEFDQASEEGFQVKIDLNNKTQRNNPPTHSNFSSLLNNAKITVENEFTTLFGPERASRVLKAIGLQA